MHPSSACFSRTMQVLERLSKSGSPTDREAVQRAMATLRTCLPRAEKEQAKQSPNGGRAAPPCGRYRRTDEQ